MRYSLALMTSRAVLAFALLVLAVPASAEEPASRSAARAPTARAELTVFNRHVTTFRVPLLGVSPDDRAERARDRIEDLLARPGKHEVTDKASPVGRVVSIDGSMAFLLVPEDADSLQGEDFEDTVRRAVQAVQRVADETRESRDVKALGKGFLYSVVATAVLVLLVWALRRFRQAAIRSLGSLAERTAGKLKLGGTELLNRERLLKLIQWLVKIFTGS